MLTDGAHATADHTNKSHIKSHISDCCAGGWPAGGCAGSTFSLRPVRDAGAIERLGNAHAVDLILVDDVAGTGSDQARAMCRRHGAADDDDRSVESGVTQLGNGQQRFRRWIAHITKKGECRHLLAKVVERIRQRACPPYRHLIAE